MKASLSLGLSKENLLLKIVIPWSKKGIIAATILGFGRAIGETVAVLMVSGNIVQVPQSIFSPIRTMTANIALEMGYAMEFHRSSLFVCGLILCLVVAFFIGFLNTEEVKGK